jgi:hypothetical protein
MFVNAMGALTFVVQDETWPVFIEWVRKTHPEALDPQVDTEKLRGAFYEDALQLSRLNC